MSGYPDLRWRRLLGQLRERAVPPAAEAVSLKFLPFNTTEVAMNRQHVELQATVAGTEILATDTLVESRLKLARITLDSMVQFVGLLDANGNVLEINKVALDAIGIQLSDVLGKPFWTTFWWQVSDEVVKTVESNVARARKGEAVQWDTPLYGHPDSRETIILDAIFRPVADDAGNVVFIVAEGRDITAHKAQELEIVRKNQELKDLLQRVSELDEIKTQFFANVSHELRTPLALIVGPAERLLDEERELSDAERADAARVIVRNGKMLLKHVNDLLDMSRLEAGKLDVFLQESFLFRIGSVHRRALRGARCGKKDIAGGRGA